MRNQRQRFSIFQRSVLPSSPTRESRTGGDTSGRSACRWGEWRSAVGGEGEGKDEGKRAKTVAEERGDPDFFASLHQRKAYLKVAHHFSWGELLAPRLPTLPLLCPFRMIDRSELLSFYPRWRMEENKKENAHNNHFNIILIYTI